MYGRFTYPFCYVPHPGVLTASRKLIARIDADCSLKDIFREGKMLGVMIARDLNGNEVELFAFSGLAGGKSHIDGFVGPIYDTEELTPAVSAEDSRRIQSMLFEQYRVHNAYGQEASVAEIFALRGLVPPGGTGDCAGPKLLEHAYRNNLTPLAMGEFWYGNSSGSQVRSQGSFYPSCTGKCGPLLTWMMQGLDLEANPLEKGFGTDYDPVVLFEDDSIIVADKPSGMLSVPGRTDAVSLLDWLSQKYGEVHSCHRLDMDTSGVMVFARKVAYKAELERQFAAREVSKTYRARLIAGSSPFRHARKGTIALPLALDYYDRPRQMIDFENGKKAITKYEVLDILPSGEIDILFTPLTGRTHQLRVHAAHEKGLGHPIKGDRLYGDANGGRLHLHATSIEFTHPQSEERMRFSSDPH